MLTRGWAGGRGDGLLRTTVAGSTDGLTVAALDGDAGRGAAAAVHPASAQQPASALAASVCLAIPTVIPASTLPAHGYANMKPRPRPRRQPSLLRTGVLTAQSARLDGVSGATYTSEAHAAALQAALDALHMK